jgi:hypothetical protein
MFGMVRAWLRPTVSASAVIATTVTPSPEPEIRDPSDMAKRQWQQLGAIIDQGMTTAGTLQQLQKSASDRLDAAGYALEGLRAELAAAMPLPSLATRPDVAAATATVHQLEPRLDAGKDQALAA